MIKSLHRCIVAVALVAAAASAHAQSPSGASELNRLLDELNELLDKGERERLLDPWFLRDLRNVVNKYDNPWRRRLLHDEFSGRDPNPAPPWRVTAGEFLVDWRYGLRSVVQPTSSTSSASTGSQPQQSQSDEDVAKALIGAILQQALEGQQGGQSGSAGTGASQPPSSTTQSFASVAAELSISNAFAIELQVSSRPGTTLGRLEFGPYQGASRSTGYALVYTPGTSPTLVLVSVTSRGTSTLDFVEPAPNLSDGQPHRVRWTRDKNGSMRIDVDDRQIMQVTDRSFRQPFNGFQIFNRGGDYAFRRITIDGV